MLAIMPMFHGFGLGVSIHSMVANGGHCILIPPFTAQSYAELIKYASPIIAGVPSLFEALLRVKGDRGADLSCLLGVFSGGDSLSVELKAKAVWRLPGNTGPRDRSGKDTALPSVSPPAACYFR